MATKSQRSGFGSYPIRLAALGLLMDKPHHGYELYSIFKDVFGSIWKAGQAKFYVALAALEEAGYLGSQEIPQPNRPTRKVYHITDAGRELFAEWLAKPVSSMRAVRVELIAKLRFYSLLGLPGQDALITAQVNAMQAMIDEWTEAKDTNASADHYEPLILDYKIHQATAIIDWLNTNREKFI